MISWLGSLIQKSKLGHGIHSVNTYLIVCSRHDTDSQENQESDGIACDLHFGIVFFVC